MAVLKSQRSGKVAVITTGGTIASRRHVTTGALVSVDTGAELLSSLGELAPPQEVVLEEFCKVGSNLIDLDLSFRLARRIEEFLREDCILGCVVTHGTDTLEESAFLANLVVSSSKPVVFTGSQHAADQSNADGPRNLADAIRVAATPDADGLGVVVVFDGKILSAVDATKVHTSRAMGFDSSGLGPLGEIDLDSVLITRRLSSYPRVDVARIESRVDLLTLTMGADDRLFEAAVSLGARGIVLEAFGRGNGTREVVAAVSRATKKGIVTIVASRCLHGRVLPHYSDGGGRDLEAAGAIFAGRLRGPKARILLCVALANAPEGGIAALFTQFGR